jgi:glycerol-3-phosphate dehydrogenase (NAD(P)+)
MRFQHIAVVGAGAWGVALANALARAGRDVILWGRDATAVEAMQRTRESPRLPGAKLEAPVTPTADLEAAAACEAMVLAVPAQALRESARALGRSAADATPAVICAKGFERGSRAFMSEIVAQEMPQATPAILSGPSFAADVARGLPTAVTLAARDEALARELAAAFGSTTFRPYHATDIRGVEIGGAAKNVLAIAAGIVAGRRLGASAAAALVTRGFAELVRFGAAYGARPETLTGLSGLGDLVLTCSSPQSRNFSFGVALGSGEPPERAAHGKLAEGAFTASVLVEMAAARGVDMPIAGAVSAVLDGALGIDAAIESLLARPFKSEA